MRKLYALLIMFSFGSAAFSQDKNGQLDSLCHQLIAELQKASEKDSIKVDLFSGHMGSVSKLEIRMIKLRDSFQVECRTGDQFVYGPYERDTLKFKTTLRTKYWLSSEQLIANLKEEMKAVKNRMNFLPDAYSAMLYADAKTRDFSLGYGTGYGFAYLFRNGMTYEQHRKIRSKAMQN